MKKTINILVDYKGHFGSKNNSEFYRSGMDLNNLKEYFADRGYAVKIIRMANVEFKSRNWRNQIVLYTSQEDRGFIYKSYIEDIILALELAGAKVIPAYKFLRANNNKVFMELLRNMQPNEDMKSIISAHFGVYEELKQSNLDFNQSYVLKTAKGAKSRGVFLAKDKNKILQIAKKISASPEFIQDIKDKLRPIKHKGYIKNSTNRKKFILQNFVENLANDWKILVFGDKYYLEYRGVREKDFRASGSQNFFLNDDIPLKIPDGIFDFAKSIRNTLNTPHLSLDIGYNNKDFYLFEFQALYFSSYAHEKSSCYYKEIDNQFIRVNENYPLEKVYTDGVCDFIENDFQLF